MTSKTLEVGVLVVDEAVQYTDIAPVDALAMIAPEYVALLGPAVTHLQSQAIPMNISYISERNEELHPLTAGARIAITHSLATAPPLDILFIPGPPPVFVNRPAVDAYIQSAVARGTTILSICTGAFPVAAAGVLDGRTATAPLSILGMLRNAHPQVQWESARRFEKSVGVDGKGEIWTSGCVANGIDLVCAFMRDRFPESRALIDLIIPFAGFPDRDVEYDEKEKAVETAFGGAGVPAQ
ncbi:class I glutamine amidotransferase-like protein [Macrophomina phaseolina]|uniref:Class I glutamine amidotransferase-like protein n=1 Tax=Macrophomina phaseolina TaxID=35725 RepID=A0ABQ8FSM2_9PEZI|nr:class I glutamine amidotransferase-like protein [Macrophomina phaseolina]